MALVATDWESPAEVDENALRATRYDGSSPNGPQSFRYARRAKWQRDLRRAVSNCCRYRFARRRRVPDHAHYNEPARLCL